MKVDRIFAEQSMSVAPLLDYAFVKPKLLLEALAKKIRLAR
jgi:hypothetical protein